jgi:propanol-preferring alcohol dehydrogenase
MVLDAPGKPLRLERRAMPTPMGDDILLQVQACAVCRTDLHVVDGDLPNPRLPIIPGHEIVGTVVARGASVTRFAVGDRVGVPWLGGTCRSCAYCNTGRENLCDHPTFTGYTRDGGFASHTLVDARYALPLAIERSDVECAPLLCAGLIGWRCLKRAGEAGALGLFGFGAAAHLVAQVALGQGRRVYAFTRPGDAPAQDLARHVGCTWAGGSDEAPPEQLDAAIIFAPVGTLVPQALGRVRKGGRVVCGGIHMSDIPQFPYRLLWEEREVCSVANLTRTDAAEFLALPSAAKLHVATTTYPLERANEALADLRTGKLTGAAVLVP